MSLRVQIEKRLGGFHLEASFEVEAGERLALLGASGSGKSLTLKCAAGVARPDRGRVSLEGLTLFDSASGVDLPPQKRHVGYLFQNYALFPHMTAAENVSLVLHGLPRRQRLARTGELLDLMGLTGQADLRPGQLSGGQQQRVALARILASRPRAILLDEPLSALDAPLRWQVEQALEEALSDFGGPVVWVSHDLAELRRNCPRVCLLEEGRGAPTRTLEDLWARPGTLTAARLTGCRNLVPAGPGPEPETVLVPSWGAVLKTAGPWPEGASWLGIRASEVRPDPPPEAPNALPCRVLRRLEDLHAALAALVPESRPEAPPLWLELPQGTSLPDGAPLTVALPPEALMPLTASKN